MRHGVALVVAAVVCAALMVGCQGDPKCASLLAGVSSQRLPFKARLAETADFTPQNLAVRGPHVISFGDGQMVLLLGGGSCIGPGTVSSVTVTSDARALVEFHGHSGPCTATAILFVVTARTRPTTPRPTTVTMLQGCRRLG